MYFLTQELPSGYDYPFISINVNPMTFAQILEYMESIPPSPLERFYLDYNMVAQDDRNVDNLLLCDLEFIIFYKKCLTISKNLRLTVKTKCYECGSALDVNFNLTQIRFKKLNEIKIDDSDKTLLDGLSVKIEGSYHKVRMPTTLQFLKVFSRFRVYKKVANITIIKLIALFEDSDMYQNQYEPINVNAVHQGITRNVVLDNLFYKTVEPIKCECKECKNNFERLKLLKMEAIKAEDDLDAERRLKELEESKYGGTTVGIDSLIVNLFREVIDNNKLAKDEIRSGASGDKQRGELYDEVSQ